MPLQRLHRANVVVHDLRTTARNYAEFLGINRWRVSHVTTDRLTASSAFGFTATFSYSTATGSNANGVTFRLVQPTSGMSTFTEFLLARGEGVHSICATRVDHPADLGRLTEQLSAQGVSVGQSGTVDGSLVEVMFETRDRLGGFFLEVVSGDVAPDEEWDFSDRADPPPVLAGISRIGHFGVAVPNLMSRLPEYAQLLGLEHWSGVHFHPGSLVSSTFNGQPVQHAFLLAIAGREDVTFELLQPTSGPTDYSAFIERTGGPGIHHLLLLRELPQTEWLALRHWMEQHEAPVVMSGRVRSGAEFFYLDTRALLGGWLVEVIVAGRSGSTDAQSDPLGRFTLDLSTPVQGG